MQLSFKAWLIVCALLCSERDWASGEERSASRSEASGRIENVLLIISDDLKASVLPAYGDQVCRTPNIDRLAQSGMVFERAYCQGLACATIAAIIDAEYLSKINRYGADDRRAPATARNPYRAGGQDIPYASAARATRRQPRR